MGGLPWAMLGMAHVDSIRVLLARPTCTEAWEMWLASVPRKT